MFIEVLDRESDTNTRVWISLLLLLMKMRKGCFKYMLANASPCSLALPMQRKICIVFIEVLDRESDNNSAVVR